MKNPLTIIESAFRFVGALLIFALFWIDERWARWTEEEESP